MTKWLVQKQTHKSTQNTQNTKTQQTFVKHYFLCFFGFFFCYLIFYLWLLCFLATMALLYSQVIQLCQNCPTDRSCSGTVVQGAVSSEDCYNYLNTSGNAQMISFDYSGACWAYDVNTCMQPPRSYDSHGTWSARLVQETGNPRALLFVEMQHNRFKRVVHAKHNLQIEVVTGP